MNTSRPNTAVPEDCLSQRTILCCGEDPKELVGCFSGGNEILSYHEYRCYRFWKFKSYGVIWTGIGTGCLEPLLFEILGSQTIKQIILIGTAGALNGNTQLGEYFLIDKAYLGCTAISSNPTIAHRPRWKGKTTRAKSASAVSTDYYYGFSRMQLDGVGMLQAEDTNLRKQLDYFSAKVDLVDMETAQFYYFCSTLGAKDLEFLALRGPANTVTDVTSQTTYSEALLKREFNECLHLFGFPLEKLSIKD